MQSYDAHKSTTEVRQGNKRQMNMRVLVLSVVGIIVAFALVFLVFSMMPQGNVIQ